MQTHRGAPAADRREQFGETARALGGDADAQAGHRRERRVPQAREHRAQNESLEERFAAVLKLAELPRNSSATRIRNRCEVTGRPRGYYRKHKLSRIALRDLGSKGLIPGLLKSSW